MQYVLIVDDEALVAETICSTIPWKEYDMQVVHCATNAYSALQYLRLHPVDIVFTDIKMPQMSGIELLKRVHDACPQISFVMLSAWSDFAMVKESFQHGALDYILKIDIDDAPTVRRLLCRLQERYSQHRCSPPADHGISKISLEYSLPLALDYQALALRADPPFLCLDLIESLRALAPDLVVQHTHKLVCVITAASQDLQSILRQIPRNKLEYYRIGISERSSSFAEAVSHASAAVFYASNGIPRLYVPRTSAYRELWNQLAEISVLETAVQLHDLKKLLKRLLESAAVSFVPPLLLCEDVYRLFSSWMADALDRLNHYQASADFVNSFCSLDDLNIAVDNLVHSLFTLLQENTSIFLQSRQYIHVHFAEPGLSINDIARALGVSARYISTEIYNQTGLHFKQYLNDLRIRKAIMLMQNTTLRVNEICERSGYASIEHFSRVFSKQTGTSPMTYMKNIRTHIESESEL